MAVCILIYSHVAAISLTGLASYWDRTGNVPHYAAFLIPIGGLAALSAFIYPFAAAAVIGMPTIPSPDKNFAVVAEIVAVPVHFIAMLPLIQ